MRRVRARGLHRAPPVFAPWSMTTASVKMSLGSSVGPQSLSTCQQPATQPFPSMHLPIASRRSPSVAARQDPGAGAQFRGRILMLPPLEKVSRWRCPHRPEKGFGTATRTSPPRSMRGQCQYAPQGREYHRHGRRCLRLSMECSQKFRGCRTGAHGKLPCRLIELRNP